MNSLRNNKINVISGQSTLKLGGIAKISTFLSYLVVEILNSEVLASLTDQLNKSIRNNYHN